ncbi:MAG: patatin-like phospholipase family protein [Eubacteriales bacterium]|nr:patatin-like phospholipase family protein [Eubacteriales bacterium]
MARLGLALGGGGTRGAFEIGAWKAFRELDIEFAAIVGTSIGAINGALMLSCGYERALELWQNLNYEQCLAFSAPLELKSSDLLALKNSDILAKEILAQGGLDTGPLRELLQDYIDEQAIRSHPVRYGLLTVQLNDLKAEPRWIEDIPAGQLIDFIMASAHLPGLQPVQIDGKRYLDGGFAENVPVSMLRRQGFRHLVAVDLEPRVSVRRPVDDNTQLTLIHDPQDLGSLLDLDPVLIRRNQALGYLDAMKAFDRLNGDYYAFAPDDHARLLRDYGPDLLSGFEQAALAFELDRSRMYAADDFLAQVRSLHLTARQHYEQRRQELQVESKLAAITGGSLRALRMQPAMRLEFLAELSTSLEPGKHPLKIPLKLFPNLNWTAKALQQLDSL